MVDLSFHQIRTALKDLDLPQFDVVVGIARGGVVLSALAAYETGSELRVVQFNFRDEDKTPRFDAPRQLSDLDLPPGTRHILLVDDVSVTGRTLDAARALLSDYEVKTLVLKGRADYALFPNIASCVEVPWSIAVPEPAGYVPDKL